MKKKILALVLAALMLVSVLAACNKGGSGGGSTTTTVSGEYEEVEINGYKYKKAKDMTTDNITLTIHQFDQKEVYELLAQRFHEIYPNINVVVSYATVGDDYNNALTSMVQNNQAPDVLMYSDCDYALSNGYLLDFSSFWNSDPETQNLADTINDAGLGCFNLEGGQRYAVPFKFFPGIIYIDKNVMKTLNIPMPDQTWTWSEMINIIKQATGHADIDGMKYYGLYPYNRLDSYYGIAARQDIIGEFGFNGQEFDLSEWAIGEQEFSDLKLGGYVCPDRESDANEAWTGDWDTWAGATSHVAVFSEAFWTFQSSWNNPSFKEANPTIDIYPYVVPAVSEADASAGHHSIATLDFGGIGSGTKYPREAYELMKFVSFGIDGWHTRNEIYANEENVNASGTPLKYDVMPVPLTKDETILNEYVNNVYCAGMDDEHKEAWKTYFQSCMQPISFGWTNIAGYNNFLVNYFNNLSIHTLVDNGSAKAADYKDEAKRQADYYHAKAMLDDFGPTSLYKVLNEDEIARYQAVVDAFEKG